MQEQYYFTDYLIVYFDVLGQRESLRRIKQIPTAEDEQKEFLGLVRDSLGKVLALRDGFSNFFKAAESYTPNTSLVPSEFRSEFIEAQKANYSFYGLSDAVVISVPLTAENENCTAMNGVHSALIATCGIGLLALSVGVPARAGIDVGVATQIGEREVYGPALERAVNLEGELAEYPRFLVGNELLSYLGWVENGKYNTPFGQIAIGISQLCRKMIVRDSDGRFMLDFLGETVKDSSENSIDKGIVDNARKFVEAQYQRCASSGSEKLASRYYRLLRYFEGRKKVWE